MIPDRPCPRCSMVGALFAASKKALADVSAAAERLGAQPPPRRVAPVTWAAEVALTGRELDVLARIAEGWQNADIARELFIAEATVKSHVTRLHEKLGVRDRAHAVHVAWQRGYLGKDEAAA